MVKKKKPPDQDANFTKKYSPYRTIKTSLKSIIKDPEIHNKINELVIHCNHIVIDAYMFIRLYALKQYHLNEVIPILDEDFISYVIKALGTCNNGGRALKNKDLTDKLNNFYIKEFQPIFNHQKFNLNKLSYTLPYICRTMETCIRTNLKEHFAKRLARFINIFADKYYDDHYGTGTNTTSNEYKKEKKQLIWKLKKAVLYNKFEEIPEQLKDWFDKNKGFLIPNDIVKCIPYDCKSSPYKYIRYSFNINYYYEVHNANIKIYILEQKKN